MIKCATGTCSTKWVRATQRHLFATVPKDNVCVCGCHGRHTIDSTLGTFDWSMKITHGGVHPLTSHDLQHLDAQRSLLVGKPLGFSGGVFQARGDWAFVPTNLWSSILEWHNDMLEMQQATSDDNMPYWDFSLGAKLSTKRHKPKTLFKAQRLARATVSLLFTCPGFTLDMVCIGIMHCRELGVAQNVFGNIFS